MTLLRLVAVIVVVSTYSVSPVLAQLSPGDLTKAHAELEGLKSCKKCHDENQGISSGKCLECHKALGERIAAGKGWHARRENAKCTDCHVEHQGRDAALIFWKEGQEKFDHSTTGYTLDGGHFLLKCRQCHTPESIAQKVQLQKQSVNVKQTFLGLTPDCQGCHRDEHRAQFSQTCTDCHTTVRWKPADKFDHTKSTFPLTGKHQTTACGSCHPIVRDAKFVDDPDFRRFKGIAGRLCVDCHKDYHAGRLSTQCAQCHSPAGWQVQNTVAFDHSLTGYPLAGKHTSVACAKCHMPGKPYKGLPHSRCMDCHKEEHQGQLTRRKDGGACESCHIVQGFSPSTFTIEQHQGTSFPLRGSHQAVPCTACHQKNYGVGSKPTIRILFIDSQCTDCHADIHHGSIQRFMVEKACRTCHVEESWHTVRFNHDQTQYPLQGKHATAACGGCHKKSIRSGVAELFFKIDNRNCQNCHQDIHLGQFANYGSKSEATVKCDRCHTFFDWRPVLFQHNRDSVFKLEGGHAAVACESCHRLVKIKEQSVRIFRPMASACEDCHAKK
jgi:hypothetical protein